MVWTSRVLRAAPRCHLRPRMYANRVHETVRSTTECHSTVRNISALARHFPRQNLSERCVQIRVICRLIERKLLKRLTKRNSATISAELPTPLRLSSKSSKSFDRFPFDGSHFCDYSFFV